MPYDISCYQGRSFLGTLVWNGDYELGRELARRQLADWKNADRVTITDRAGDRLLFSLVREGFRS